MSTFQKAIVAIIFILGGVLLYFLFITIDIQMQKLEIQRKQLMISEEQHIDKLFSIYQNNIAACITQAKKNNRDDNYINENCIKPINNSIVAQWLIERGYGNLLEKPKQNPK